MNPGVRVSAPSRLHFGLLRFAQDDGPSYGGLGLMLSSPMTMVQVRPSDNWHAMGPNAERALSFAKQVYDHASQLEPTPLSIEVEATPPEHSGLGSGTQLALSMARAVHELGGKQPLVDVLSASVGRGKRSAIGSHGFVHGGLLWERGRLPGQSLAELTRRLEFPSDWRVLLVIPPDSAGRHGLAEVEAFRQLPPVPDATTNSLIELAESNILPAVEQGDFSRFSESLYEYGRLAGECFASVQGGPYASAAVAKVVQTLRSMGCAGVGQSSWGPTVFAFAENQSSAETLASQLRKNPLYGAQQLIITKASNSGVEACQI